MQSSSAAERLQMGHASKFATHHGTALADAIEGHDTSAILEHRGGIGAVSQCHLTDANDSSERRSR